MSRSQEIISRRDEFKKRTKEMLNYTPLYIGKLKYQHSNTQNYNLDSLFTLSE